MSKVNPSMSLTSNELERKVQVSLTEELYRVTRPLTWSHQITGILCVALLWHISPGQHLLWWLAVLSLLSGFRFVLIRRFSCRADSSEVASWRRLYTVLEAANGLLVGLLAFLLPELGVNGSWLVILLVLITMSGAAAMLASVMSVSVAFVVSSSLPLLFMLPYSGLPITALMQFGVLFFVVQLLVKSRGIHQAQHDMTTMRITNQVMARELDQQRRAAEQVTAEKMRFLASLCHELRTPMQGMLGSLELLGRQPLATESEHWYQSAWQSGQRLLHLLNESLELSRLEQSQRQAVPAPLQPAWLVQDLAQQMEGLAQKNNLRLSVAAEDVPWVESDDSWLRQILLNLLSNAVKFTHQGEVSLQTRYEDERQQLVFTVTDTGPGMTAAQLRQIFTPFTRLGADGQTALQQGSGLGLAISRQLAEQLGGSLQAESRLGQGSCFTLRLPAPVVKQPVTLPGQEAAQMADRAGRDGDNLAGITQAVETTGSQLRVLLVEDDPICQRVVLAMLDEPGIRSDAVSHGLVAVSQALACSYDLILMDWSLPGCDGLEATRRIRAGLSQQTDNTRAAPLIIGLTAQLLPGDRSRWQQAGMDGVLSKPLSREILQQQLRAVPGYERQALQA